MVADGGDAVFSALPSDREARGGFVAVLVTTCNACVSKYAEYGFFSDKGEVAPGKVETRCRNCRRPCRGTVGVILADMPFITAELYAKKHPWPTDELLIANLQRESVDRLSMQLGVRGSTRKLVLSTGPSGRTSDACPICQDDDADAYVARSRGYLIERATGHSFHISCVNDYLYSMAIVHDAECPLCRKKWFRGSGYIESNMRTGHSPKEALGSDDEEDPRGYDHPWPPM
jgi:hypothetical protein